MKFSHSLWISSAILCFILNLGTSWAHDFSEAIKTESRTVRKAIITKRPDLKINIGILGSAEALNETEALCKELGQTLVREFPQASILTGAVRGIPDSVAFGAFLNTPEQKGAQIFHLRPRNEAWASGKAYRDEKNHPKYSLTPGTFIDVGLDMAERRDVLALSSDYAIMIEGGPGAVHEAMSAVRAGAKVIPVLNSSPFANIVFAALVGESYQRLIPAWMSETDRSGLISLIEAVRKDVKLGGDQHKWMYQLRVEWERAYTAKNYVYPKRDLEENEHKVIPENVLRETSSLIVSLIRTWEDEKTRNSELR